MAQRSIVRWIRNGLPGMLVALVSSYAFAVGTPIEESPTCKQYVGLTNRLAGCLRDTVDAGAAKFFTDFYPMVQGAITAFMTLAIIVYGILLAYGLVEKVGRDTMILLFKVAAVVAFTTSSPMIYRMTTDAMDGLAVAAISFVPPSGASDNAGSDFSQSACMQNMVRQQMEESPDGKKVIGPWLGVDCLLDTVIGIKVPPKNAAGGVTSTVEWYQKQFDPKNTTTEPENPGMARALLFLFFSGVQSSILGIIFAVLGFLFIMGLLLVVVKAFFTYIAAYIGIALLVIVSPMFIPLLLFKSTKVYFDKWVRLMISFSLQPVVMMVFITFSLAAVDFAVFSGNYSVVYRIAGEASREQGFNLNKYLTAPRDKAGNRVDAPASDGSGEPVPPDEDTSPIIKRAPRTLYEIKGAPPVKMPQLDKVLGGMAPGTMNSKCTKKDIEDDKTGATRAACNSKYAVQAWAQSIDWNKMAAARAVEGNLPIQLEEGEESTEQSDGQQISREVLAAMVFAAIVIFVMNGLMAVIPFLANDILGDAGQSPNIGEAVAGKFGGTATGFGGDAFAKIKGLVSK